MNWQKSHTLIVVLGILVAAAGEINAQAPAGSPLAIYAGLVGGVVTALLTALGVAAPSALQPKPPVNPPPEMH